MISASPHFRRAVTLVMIAAISALACARVTEVTDPAPRRLPVTVTMDTGGPIRFQLPTRPGQLTAEQTAAIATRIASLRAEPARLVIRVGDTVSVPMLVRILAFDSAGAPLGELNRYDFTTRGSSLFLLRDGTHVTAHRPALSTIPCGTRPSTRWPTYLREGDRNVTVVKQRWSAPSHGDREWQVRHARAGF